MHLIRVKNPPNKYADKVYNSGKGNAMGSFIANAAGRKAFMDMATKAVGDAIAQAESEGLPPAYDSPRKSAPTVHKPTHKHTKKTPLAPHDRPHYRR